MTQPILSDNTRHILRWQGWRKRLLLTIITLTVTVLIAVKPLYANPVLHYAPELVTITGVVTDKIFPGPPNYGESATDQKVTVPVILLDHPVDVLPGANMQDTDPDNQTETEVKMMQLFTDNKPMRLRGCLKLTGTLMHQISAHHYTRILMNVKHAEKVKECR